MVALHCRLEKCVVCMLMMNHAKGLRDSSSPSPKWDAFKPGMTAYYRLFTSEPHDRCFIWCIERMQRGFCDRSFGIKLPALIDWTLSNWVSCAKGSRACQLQFLPWYCCLTSVSFTLPLTWWPIALGCITQKKRTSLFELRSAWGVMPL